MLLVIVNYLSVGRSRRSVDPFKADSPLIVDADAVLSLAVAFESFEPIAWQCGQVLQRSCGVQPVEFKLRRPFEPGECLDPFAGDKGSDALVAAG